MARTGLLRHSQHWLKTGFFSCTLVAWVVAVFTEAVQNASFDGINSATNIGEAGGCNNVEHGYCRPPEPTLPVHDVTKVSQVAPNRY